MIATRILIISFCLLLTSCSNRILSPVWRGQTTEDPGDFWDPSKSEWYCPRATPTNPIEKIILPQKEEDLDLPDLLDIALRNHPQTKLAWAQARAAAFAVGMAESALYPVIEDVVNVGVSDIKGANVRNVAGSTNNTTTGFNAPGYTNWIVNDLTFSYLILDFGGREASIQSARFALQALDWTQNRVLQQVIFTVIQGYYNYINAKEMLQARIDDLNNAKINLDLAKALFEGGLNRRVDVLQAQANYENAELILITAQSQVKINLGTLAFSLGIPPSSCFEAKNFPAHFPVNEIAETIDELMCIAKDKRPDLASAYATVLQTQADYRSSLSAGMPTLTANVQLVGTHYWDHSRLDGHNDNGAISLNIPLFSGFFYENQIRQAKENIKAARANLEELENSAMHDVVTSYYNFETAKKSLVYSEEYLKSAQEAYDLSLEAYRNGVGSMVDLLAALATLSEARATRITNRTNWAVSLFNIAFSVGTLDVQTLRNAGVK